jgi:protein involved in polysaccharide export with SLBB domain
MFDRRSLLVPFAWTCAALSGCTMFDTATPSSAQSTPLSWLTNWVSQPLEMGPGFDVESIKRVPGPVAVHPDNLLEITVWDLYEPGKPYSYPVRVSNRQTIEVPFLGEVSVEGKSLQEIEGLLVDKFRRSEFLLNPRVLVRGLDSSVVKVHVAGAVIRAGFVELERSDPSVYAAILAAGGLKKTSGTQVAVTRRTAAVSAGASAPEIRSGGPAATREIDGAVPDPANRAAPRANSVDELSVPAQTPAARPWPAHVNSHNPPARRDVGAGRDGAGAGPDQSTIWFDVTLAQDREQLKLLQLDDGDTVAVKATAPPLRIGGIVHRPGAYPLPPDRPLNVWQAIEQAGGVRDETVPLNITLLRPAAEGRSARRSYLHVAAYAQHPPDAPRVESGDVLQVEPTTGSKIRRAVGDLWKP